MVDAHKLPQHRSQDHTRDLQRRALLEVDLESEMRLSSTLSSALLTAKTAMEKQFEVKVIQDLEATEQWLEFNASF